MNEELPNNPTADKTPEVSPETRIKPARVGRRKKDLGSNRKLITAVIKGQNRPAKPPTAQLPIGCLWLFFNFQLILSLGLFLSLFASHFSTVGLVLVSTVLCFSLFLTVLAGSWLKNRLVAPQVRAVELYREVSDITYETLPGPLDDAYKKLFFAFYGLAEVARVTLEDLRKSREAARIVYGLPTFVKASFQAPALAFGPLTYYFLPDRLIIESPATAPHILNYRDMTVSFEQKEVFELDGPPGDAEIIGETWLYATKSGEADKRYSYNPKGVITTCGHIRLLAQGQLDDYIRVSRPGRAEGVVFALQDLVAISQPSVFWPETPQAGDRG